ncbi:MAG: hypothetical protein HY084_06265 [Gemmatimonadetes bacterium]|nr:hypothetical protein [Gemmatimonadota bacterium]
MCVDRDERQPGDRRDSIDRRSLLRAAAASVALSALGPSWLAAASSARSLEADDRYLDAARKAERWIARAAIRDERGITWPADPLDPKTVQNNLYSGSPGVLLFYLELHRATGDAALLETARGAADYLIATLPNRGAPLRDEDAGLYTGIAGVAYALALTADATRDAKYERAVRHIGTLLREGLVAKGAGAAWNDSNDIISGSSGVLLALLWLEGRDPAWRDWRDAEPRVVRALVDAGTAEHGGLKWGAGPALPRRYPNFSHGTAGVGYALATFAERDPRSEVSKDALAAALAGATYLDAIATDMPDGGRKIFHDEPGGEQLYYLSWCHGPAGTSRFYQRLA